MEVLFIFMPLFRPKRREAPGSRIPKRVYQPEPSESEPKLPLFLPGPLPGFPDLPLPSLPFPFPLPPLPGLGEEEEEPEELEWEEKGEEEKVVYLLLVANSKLKAGNIKGAYAHMVYAIKLSTCSRCIRNIKSIAQMIKSGNISEAERRLEVLTTLVPSYYSVIEGEDELGVEVELNSTKAIEKECNSCNAAEIVEICGWDTSCIDYVITFIDKKKRRGEKIFAEELIRTAKAFRKVYKDEGQY